MKIAGFGGKFFGHKSSFQQQEVKMGRRLPIYMVLDTSGSMMGEPIEAVKKGVQILVSALRQDPMALETAWLSLITFDNSARQLVPLTELADFKAPPLEASGQAALGAALNLLADRIQAEVVFSTPSQKGDWKPLIFLMTAGQPTDDWPKGLAKIKKVSTGTIIAWAADHQAGLNILKQLTENVFLLDTENVFLLDVDWDWIEAPLFVPETGTGEVKSVNDLPTPPVEVRIVL